MQGQMIGALIGAVLGVALTALVAYSYAIHVIAPKLGAVFKGITPAGPATLSDAQIFAIGANAAARSDGDAPPFADPATVSSGVPSMAEVERMIARDAAISAAAGTDNNPWPPVLDADDRKLVLLAIALDHHQHELRKRCGCAYCAPLVTAMPEITSETVE